MQTELTREQNRRGAFPVQLAPLWTAVSPYSNGCETVGWGYGLKRLEGNESCKKRGGTATGELNYIALHTRTASTAAAIDCQSTTGRGAAVDMRSSDIGSN
jgi:hypothetical protein|eukprot:CAMPEP_0174306158 /NCGR_PEP_ID=MMETSP0810-20121108/266_1 /TAXON_ID=73025 ORGANISM="Eutreptiella gymnastica-like, Strain CCMP1594" /NCGR_SAMPLE_ID=MMETSP0810 /ASSEMBLY_ACC=CAM_ASM_000659 /LENGTH=100 /DNA_ID=CAMNT_0015412783 /DNA_START=1379 /DNA_END=1681 /DNA_ORIENTATION=-